MTKLGMVLELLHGHFTRTYLEKVVFREISVYMLINSDQFLNLFLNLISRAAQEKPQKAVIGSTTTLIEIPGNDGFLSLHEAKPLTFENQAATIFASASDRSCLGNKQFSRNLSNGRYFELRYLLK